MTGKTLSPKIQAVMAMQGQPVKVIAEALGISPGAVRAHQADARKAGDIAALDISIHPLAELFPMIEGQGFDELVADVRANGIRERIVLDGTLILDGRNRFRAGLAAGLFANPVPMTAISKYFRGVLPADGEPLAFVLSRNLHRRHLSESQRAMVAARLATMGVGRPVVEVRGTGKNSLNSDDFPALSLEAAGDVLHVSRASVAVARGVVTRGVPELVEAVRDGLVSLHIAEAVAALPVEAQGEIVARGRAEILAAARQFRAERQAEKKARRADREAALAGRIEAGNAALGAEGRRYGVILADPEWRFESWSAETGMDRAADNHYPTSPLEVIKARNVAGIAARDCVLFLWATAPMLPQALEVMAAWGFAYKSHLVWDKGDCGNGYWFRNRHELLLVGTRGTVPAPAMGDQPASVLVAPRGAHSEKPDAVHGLIETWFPTLPKIELNARVARPGWAVWGAEAPEVE